MKLILPDRTIRNLGREPLTIDTILRAEGINPIEVMVSRDGRLVTEDTVAGGDDELRVIRISHGG